MRLLSKLFLLLTLSFTLFAESEGGAGDGGGGNSSTSTPSETAALIQEIIEDHFTQYPFYKQTLISDFVLHNFRSDERDETFLKYFLPFAFEYEGQPIDFSSINLESFREDGVSLEGYSIREFPPLVFEIKEDQPCYDYEGNEKDGAHNQGIICISALRMARHPRESASTAIIVLIMHEISHQLGVAANNEEEALYIEDIIRRNISIAHTRNLNNRLNYMTHDILEKLETLDHIYKLNFYGDNFYPEHRMRVGVAILETATEIIVLSQTLSLFSSTTDLDYDEEVSVISLLLGQWNQGMARALISLGNPANEEIPTLALESAKSVCLSTYDFFRDLHQLATISSNIEYYLDYSQLMIMAENSEETCDRFGDSLNE